MALSWRLLTTFFLSLQLFRNAFAEPWSEDTVAKRAAYGKNGAVASENAQCTDIGIALLKQGGTAADALVGTGEYHVKLSYKPGAFILDHASCFNVGIFPGYAVVPLVEKHYHSGIGGGGFGLFRAPNGKYEFVDFREMAPAAASRNMYRDNYDGSLYGGLASGVPGEIRGLEYIHNKYGKLPWKTVVKPAIKIARFGFPVTQDLVDYMHDAIEDAGRGNFLVKDPSFAIDFAPNGTLVKLGDTITRKRYANTLETIANFGPDAFYTGAIAKATIAAVQGSNGTMTMADLTNYQVAIRKPEQITYRNYRITSGTAPSSGAVALATMKTVEGYDDLGDPAAINISTHRLDEAMRWAYAERAHLGDPNFVPSVLSYQTQMLSPETAANTRTQITRNTHKPKYYDPRKLAIQNTPGTSQVAIADASGMAVSLTTTVNLLFGSLLCVPETGIIMNDEMNDFSIPGSSNSFGYIPSRANFIRPGKRPLSSISPTIVERLADSSLYFVTGAAGGSRIITSTVQSMWHVLDQGLNARAALTRKRFHDQLVPNTIQMEKGYDKGVVQFMRDRKHNVTFVPVAESSVQVVRRLADGRFEAQGEPRQDNAKGSVF